MSDEKFDKEFIAEAKKDNEDAQVILQGIYDVLKKEKENAEIEKVLRTSGVASSCYRIMHLLAEKCDANFGIPELVTFSQHCIRIGAYVALHRREFDKLTEGFDKLMEGVDINLDDLG
jgi:hypothetical protein